MVIAQAVLAIPIVTALVHRAGERAWARYGDELICDGASRLQAIPPILAIIRADLLTAVLAGFGRTISEVGAVILVGGNIRGLDPNDDDGDCAADQPGRPVAWPWRSGPCWSASAFRSAPPCSRWRARRERRGATKYDAAVGVWRSCGYGSRPSGCGAGKSIVLASTTSVEDSGLLATILPPFTAKTGIDVKVVAQGTGKALDTARRGDADLVLVHDPEAEQQFMDEGHGATRGRSPGTILSSSGPTADPAHVRGGHDSVAALQAIAVGAGALRVARRQERHQCAELRLWKLAGQTPDSRRRRNGIATSAAAWARPSMPRAR